MRQRLVDAAVQQACAQAAQALRASPAALTTDVHGAPSPTVFPLEEASVPAGWRRALRRPRGQVDLAAVAAVGPESRAELADRTDVLLAGLELDEFSTARPGQTPGLTTWRITAGCGGIDGG
jgi:hypothetical protein